MHHKLKFTVEIEKDYTLSFLDVLVKFENKIFTTDLFRKNTFTGKYVPSVSFCTLSKNRDLISCLTIVVSASVPLLRRLDKKIKD